MAGDPIAFQRLYQDIRGLLRGDKEVYVEKLVIDNFRCFEHAELELNYPGRPATETRPVPTHLENVNLLLGDNGSGKTSVFRAIAISVLHPVLPNSGYKTGYLVRRARTADTPSRADITATLRLTKAESSIGLFGDLMSFASIHMSGDTELIGHSTDMPMRVAPDVLETYASVSASMYFENNPALFIAGYGANRRSAIPDGYSEKLRSVRYQRVAGLFEDHVGLVPFAWAFSRIKDRGYLPEAIDILNALLPGEMELSPDTDADGQPMFSHHEVLLPFSELSDGYRTFIAWVWDLCYQMARIQYPDNERPPLREFTGVVIVDEIDLFLHPEWQRTVIDRVARAFPRLQFLFSTHSPIVAGTLEPANILIMDGQKVEQYQEPVYGLTPNQILTSSYFGLSSTRAPGTGTLSDLAREMLGRPNGINALVEQAEPEDLALSPQARAVRMLDEIGE